MKKIILLISIIAGINAKAQTYQANLLKNITQNLYTNEYIKYQNKIYFSANNASASIQNNELWGTDGTSAGTVMVKDLSSSTNGSSPQSFVIMNNILYFLANDGNGFELYKTDGTSAGTVMVKNINPGSPSSIISPPYLYNNALYFYADDNVNGIELWKSDGTSAGTVMVNDINPG